MNTKFSFDSRFHEPKLPLRRLIESIWYARGQVPYQREKIAPTGSVVAVFVLGDPIAVTSRNGEGDAVVTSRGFLLGPHAGPVINEPLGETHAVGIVTTPVGAEATFGIRPARFRGRVFELEDCWPGADLLRERLFEAGDPDEMVELLESYLTDHADAGQVLGLARCERALALLEDDPTQPIASIASTIGISHGHLDREFTRIVGLTPLTISRLLRLRRLLSELDAGGPVDWAGLAADLGWFDQAHLVRDFKRHTGVTPTAYLAAQRQHLPLDDLEQAAGFVPEGERDPEKG